MIRFAQHDTHSQRRRSGKKKTRNSFLMSLIIHGIALGLISLSYIRWYQPLPPSEPLVSETITVTVLPRFHVTSLRRHSMPGAQRTRPDASPSHKPNTPMQPRYSIAAHSSPSTALNPQPAMRLPVAEIALRPPNPELNSLTAAAVTHKQFATDKLRAVLAVHTPVREPTQAVHQANRDTLEPSPGRIDRDGQIGKALEGIAESVANGNNEQVSVDIVFLLDISGSMIDNIRAVGRQLTGMIEIFEEKGVDFTLGVVLFRYLDDDTIIHPQTRNAGKYKRLLTSHVVAAAGDERAHNAIIKTIRRVAFRQEAKRRFILITDEASKGSYSLSEVLVQCLKQEIVVDIIGINHTSHKALTVKTGGLWFPIPKQE